MPLRRYPLRWSLIVAVIAVVASLFWVGVQRVRIDTDIAASLPHHDPVLADARYVMAHHPLQERIVIDLGHGQGDLHALRAGASFVEEKLRQSGLFKKVGWEDEQQLFPELIILVTEHLPTLFTAVELEDKVKPLLSGTKVQEAIRQWHSQLANLDGIGQGALIAQDPLGLRNLVMARLSHLAPAKGAHLYQGRLLSADRKHLLILAEPAGTGTDTRFARQVTALLTEISSEMSRTLTEAGVLVLTPVGAYRAALDNETTAKGDTRKAVIFSTLAIALLLLLGFPRPFIGLLALLPAFAGTMMAFFVYSLFRDSISMMAVGFGGAIISFTVDYGIAYLLFLDRPYETHGLEATREVWSLGLLAMLTTAVSFAFLFMSGFLALAELGWFSALGVVFTYIFVHAVYPVLFPTVPPAKREGSKTLQAFVNRLASAEHRWKAWAALGLFLVMAFFAKPEFRIDLNAINSVSAETLAAEEQIRDVWGDVFSKIYLMTEADTPQALQQKGDRLAGLLESEVATGVLSSAFVPSMVLPGSARAGQNFAAWKAFWSPERLGVLRSILKGAASETGFSPQAFDPFFRMLTQKDPPPAGMPEKYFPLLGMQKRAQDSGWMQLATLIPGPAYRGGDFYHKVSQTEGVRMFDPSFFAQRLGESMFSGFLRVALIVGIITVIVSMLYLLDWQLTLIAMLPTVFALVCTVGTLNILGQPLGIPVIMVSVVVIGMGTDYALYLVRSYQRYMDEVHPSLGLIRLSVFLSFATTFLGFGILALAAHALLKSAGLALALGIGYSFVGAVTIVPPLLQQVFRPVTMPEEIVTAGSRRHHGRVLRRYRHMEGYTRLFVRFKLLLDPMFPRLARMVNNPRRIIDIGCGYGIPAVWLLELYPRAEAYGIDPDPRRVQCASRAIGGRGSAQTGKAPDLPALPERADTALMLDMIHMLTDDDLSLTLQRIHERLEAGGALIMRTTIPSDKKRPWARWFETRRLALHGMRPYYRPLDHVKTLLCAAGFAISRVELSVPGREEFWFECIRSGSPS